MGQVQDSTGRPMMLWGRGGPIQDAVGLTCRFLLLEKGPLARAEAAAALPLRSCSLWNSRSSRRCVSASFCWMAMRNNEFSVFFSSSAATSCLCMSSS